MIFSYSGFLVSPGKCQDNSLMHSLQEILLRNSSYTCYKTYLYFINPRANMLLYHLMFFMAYELKLYTSIKMDKSFDEWEFSPFGTSVFYMSLDTFANIHFIIKIMYKKTF
jgi:hypothetical protein